MRRFVLLTAAIRKACAAYITTEAPQGWEVIVREKRRSLDQNAKFHAICQRLAGSEWAGKPRTAEEWKVLLVSGHAVATKHEAEIVEGLEGELVNMRESTAAMDKRRSSSLIEYAQAHESLAKE